MLIVKISNFYHRLFVGENKSNKSTTRVVRDFLCVVTINYSSWYSLRSLIKLDRSFSSEHPEKYRLSLDQMNAHERSLRFTDLFVCSCETLRCLSFNETKITFDQASFFYNSLYTVSSPSEMEGDLL